MSSKKRSKAIMAILVDKDYGQKKGKRKKGKKLKEACGCKD